MIRSNRDPRKWRIDAVRDAPHTVMHWLEADPQLHPNVRLGISDAGDWVVSTAEGVVRFRKEIDFPGLLPLLELPLSEFQARLEAAFGFAKENRTPFPIENLVLYGLRAWGKHWPMLALAWASSLPRTEELAGALRDLMVNGATQQIRHGAKKAVFGKKSEGTPNS